MSTVATLGDASRTRRICATVSLDMVSVRRGDDSTWQWVHAWLQYSPTLTCSVVGDALIGTSSPRDCRWEAKLSIPSESSARRRRLRS
eukprot:scaffold18527_cov90-Isochrysis_galbana.AAC.2